MVKKVLIVDDEPNIVTALDYLLQHGGYEVGIATDGDEALRQAETFAPDLILLDVMLPKRSGYEVCQRIREHPEFSGTKIVFLSAKGRDTEVSKGLAVGADLYITKPFSNAELLARIGQLLGESGASSSAE